MGSTALDRIIGTVVDHHRVVLLVMLLLTAGMVVGISNAEMAEEGGIGGSIETDVDQKEQYIQEHYSVEQAGGKSVAYSPVYVRAEGGNALSKDALVATLTYTEAVRSDEDVARSLAEEEFISIASLVATQATDDPSASLAEQRGALESMSEEEVADLVRTTVAREPMAGFLLPDSYEPGTATAESHQLVFVFESESPIPPTDAQEVLYEAAQDRTNPEMFTLGEHAGQDLARTNIGNTLTLVVPVVLGLIFVVAALTYRDPVDVLVGVAGVFVSIIWMFGIMGWTGIPIGAAAVIGPVLIAGLSIDYGFHVFMRYREQRGTAEPIKPPMRRAVRALSLALGLVTITASIGFLTNLFNPVAELRQLGIGITLGVVSAFVIFVTLVPALKISVDGLLERLGLDRRKAPLGRGNVLEPVLSSTVTLARRGAPVVIAVALLVALGGGLAWTALDEETGQAPDGDVADWKEDLPDPIGWEENEVIQNRNYVSNEFRTVSDDSSDRVQFLVEGQVTSDGALMAIQTGIEAGVDSGAFAKPRVDAIRSPTSVIQDVAAENRAFAETVEAADTTGNGVPDTDLEAVYDHLYEVAPDEASQVIERTDGEYRSLRVVGPPQGADGLAPGGDRAGQLFAVADTMAGSVDGLTVTPVADAPSDQQALDTITSGILQVMVAGIVAVFLTLSLVYRRVHNSASLGAVTAGPIALVLAFVVVGMFLLEIPLTFLTALLISLVIGIGVDYNIHVSDRFAQELERGRGTVDALRTAITGTGGALLGSMLTSVGAFAGMLIHPAPAFTNFAWLVVLAMVGAFVTSVVVLPSLLYVWARRVRAVADPLPATETGTPTRADDD
ncbi:MAG: MMPL family transporter [Halovenus sp.]